MILRMHGQWKMTLLLVVLGVLSAYQIGISAYKTTSAKFLWNKVLVEIRLGKSAEGAGQGEHLKEQERLIKEITRRMGVEATLELVNNSDLPKDGTSHFLSHKIGEEAYKLHGNEALSHCTGDDLNGCSHGLIIAAVSDMGFDGVLSLLDNCKEISPYKFKMCIHGAGHSFTSLFDYQIEPAMAYCDRLSDYYSDNDKITRWCGSGLFMENTFGEHNGITPRDHPYLSQENLMYPCDIVPDRYKFSCYQNMPGWWNMVFMGDMVKMTRYCTNVPSKYLGACSSGVGAVVNSFFGNDIDKIQEYCSLNPQPFKDYCFANEAENLFSVGQRELPFILCSSIESRSIKAECYRVLKRDIEDNLLDADVFTDGCRKFEKTEINICEPEGF